jgi:hypothetical protein
MPIQGTAHCSMTNTAEQRTFTKEGPDGPLWVLMSDAEVKAFCDGPGIKLYHNRLAEHSTKHLCAFHGTWGFKFDDQAHSVSFLRYEYKGKLAAQRPEEVFDPATTLGVFGPDLYKEYKKIGAKRAVHVWQREKHGEIAIDFCVG